MYREYVASLSTRMGSGGSKKSVKGAPNGGGSVRPVKTDTKGSSSVPAVTTDRGAVRPTRTPPRGRHPVPVVTIDSVSSSKPNELSPAARVSPRTVQRTQSLQQSASHQTVEQEKSRRLSLAEDSSCTQRSLHQQITRRKSLAEDYFKELDGESPEAYDSPRPVLTTDSTRNELSPPGMKQSGMDQLLLARQKLRRSSIAEDYLKALDGDSPDTDDESRPGFTLGSVPSKNGETVTLTAEQNATKEKLAAEFKRLGGMIQDTMKLLSVREKTRVNMKRILDSGPVSPILKGDMSVSVPTTAKIVRIFTSSTFTDTMHERNTWMSDAYPRVKTFCQARGYDFQVVDMRWGVRDEAMDDHSSTDLCLRELQLCQTLSTGPNFVTLLSHKYGYRSLTRGIDASEFEKMMSVIDSKDAKDLLKKWYRKDSNAVPPRYLLSPISKHLPDFISHDKDLSKAAKARWWEDSDAMQEALESSAERALGADESKKYIISVTEKEVQMGLLSVDREKAEKSCVWFRRSIKNIEKETASYQLSRYIECLGPEGNVEKAQSLLNDLKENQIAGHLPKKNIISYSVPWTEKGINPDVSEHKRYLKKMSDDFVKTMTEMILNGINEREASRNSDPLFSECLQHIRFCQEKCANFHGREKTLEKIKAYLTTRNHKPLVTHGMSGCGKTSIMAMVAKRIPAWMSNTEPAVVIRFLGTTPDSSNINGLLISLIRQINIIYGYSIDVPEDLNGLIKELQIALRHAKPSLPLVIILDSLDQLDPTNSARSLQWLPTVLNPNVKILVSTLEDDLYECFPKLQQKLKDPDLFVAVPVLEKKDVTNIIDSWLKSHKRTLTTDQRSTLTTSFDLCPIPLFLKLSYDEACKWNSFSPADDTKLQSTVRASIDMLFSRLEVRHGQIFVSRALGYLTTASSGLSETELEDILSCDDAVLNDVYVYWTPPIRRLPPLLLVRLRTDLREYIVERGADGVRVMYWYHRQFIEAARARFCGEDVIKTLHGGLAEFFSGTWSEGNKKPYQDRSGKSGSEDRHVTAQPMQYGDTYNIRKLNNLPFHRTMASHVEAVKMECLVNFHFLLAKLVSTSVRNVVYDYQRAKKELPQDHTVDMLNDCMQLSQKALTYDPYQLAPQVLNRLAGDKDPELVQFCRQCQKCPVPYMLPDQDILIKPGGQMVYTLTDHTSAVTSLDMSMDGKIIVTCADDDEQSVKKWNVEEGTLIKSYNKLGESPQLVKFMANDSLILVEYANSLKAIQETGEIVYSMKHTSGLYVVAGKGKNTLAIFLAKAGALFDAYTGEKRPALLVNKSNPKKSFGSANQSVIAGSEKYIVLADEDEYSVTVLDVEAETFSDWLDVFPPPPEDDEDADTTSVNAIVITPDQKSFVVSNYTDNDLHFYDIKTLQKTRLIKGKESDFCQDYRMTPDGKMLYFVQDTKVIGYDLDTELRQELLPHPSTVNGVICRSWRILVTISEDTAVRVWDLTKPEKLHQTEEHSLGYRLKNLCCLSNPRYVALVVKNDKKDFISGSVIVYDLATRKVVRKGTVDDVPIAMKCVSDKEIIMATNNRKFKRVNLDTMTVTCVFQGKMCKYTNDAWELIKDAKELITLTRGNNGVKTYDMKTGKTRAVLYPPPDVKELQERFDTSTFSTNKTTTCVCRIDDGPIVVFDIQKHTCVHVIRDMALTSDSSVFWGASIPKDGSILAIQTDHNVPLPKPKKKDDYESVTSIAIYDMRKCELTSRWLIDKEYFNKYKTHESQKDRDVAVDNAMLLDDERLITSHDDFFIRVWNLKTGELIERLEGHRICAKLTTHEKSPYFLSLAEWDEENAIRVWDKASLECVASYRLDHTLDTTMLSVDGQSLISTTKLPTAQVVHWELVGIKPSVNLSTKPVTFKQGDIMTGATSGTGDAHSSGIPDLTFGFCEECEFTLALNDDAEDEKEDELDPDDDEDVKSDDDDDDEDEKGTGDDSDE